MIMLLVSGSASMALQLANDVKDHAAVTTDYAYSGRAGIELARCNSYDVIVIALNLPDMSGNDACQLIRRSGYGRSILMLTPGEALEPVLAAFESGADDALRASTSPLVLVAKLRAIERRANRRALLPVRVGDAHLDGEERVMRVRGMPVHVSATPYQALRMLMEEFPRPVASARLQRSLWPDCDDPNGSLRAAICGIRRVLLRSRSILRVKTYRGHGYALSC